MTVSTKLILPFSTTLVANTTGLVIGHLSGGNFLPGVFAAWGTWGGGTLKLQAGYTVDGANYNWFDITSLSYSSDNVAAFSFRADALQLVLTGASSPSIKVAVR